jgi:hypothetical protein
MRKRRKKWVEWGKNPHINQFGEFVDVDTDVTANLASFRKKSSRMMILNLNIGFVYTTTVLNIFSENCLILTTSATSSQSSILIFQSAQLLLKLHGYIHKDAPPESLPKKIMCYLLFLLLIREIHALIVYPFFFFFSCVTSMCFTKCNRPSKNECWVRDFPLPFFTCSLNLWV